MTPQERQMIEELFERLGKLEDTPRDGDAEAAIAAGLRRAPNAAYALVQTVLVQDEALRHANDRIEELEGREPAQAPAGGFLDSMRSALFGGDAPRSQGAMQGTMQGSMQGSVPNVPPAEANSRPRWNSGEVLGRGEPPAGDPRANAPGGAGPTFLGTAAATAAGVIGGSLLMNSIRGLTGGSQPQSLSSASGGPSGGDKASPWGSDASGSNLAREAGIDDIGKSGTDAQKQAFGNTGPDGDRQDYAANDTDDGHADDDHDDGDYDDSGYDDGDYDDDDFDDGGFDDGDSDFA